MRTSTKTQLYTIFLHWFKANETNYRCTNTVNHPPKLNTKKSITVLKSKMRRIHCCAAKLLQHHTIVSLIRVALYDLWGGAKGAECSLRKCAVWVHKPTMSSVSPGWPKKHDKFQSRGSVPTESYHVNTRILRDRALWWSFEIHRIVVTFVTFFLFYPVRPEALLKALND